MGRIDKIQLGDTVYNLGVNAENIEGKVPVDLSNYYDKEETNGLLEDKQDKLTAGINITIDENNVISASGGGEIDDDEIPCYIAQVDESGVFNTDFLDNSKNGEQVSKRLTTEQKNAIASAVSKAFKAGYKKMQLMLLFNNGSGILFDSQSGNLQNKPSNLIFTATGFSNAFNAGIGAWKLGYVYLDLLTSFGTESVSFLYNSYVRYYYNNVVDIPNITYLNNQLNNKQNKLIAGENITITGNTISASSGGGIPQYTEDSVGVYATTISSQITQFAEREWGTLQVPNTDPLITALRVLVTEAKNKNKAFGLYVYSGDGWYTNVGSAYFHCSRVPEGEAFTFTGIGRKNHSEMMISCTIYNLEDLFNDNERTYFATRNLLTLSTMNTLEYTPTGDFNPATKKYVDDSIKNYVDNLNSNEVSY